MADEPKRGTVPETAYHSDLNLLKRAEACADRVINEEHGNKQARIKDGASTEFVAVHNAGIFSASDGEMMRVEPKPNGTISVIVGAADHPRLFGESQGEVVTTATIARDGQIKAEKTEVAGPHTKALGDHVNNMTKKFGACMVSPKL